jgi:omega-6 fatty acid desaturase (delta-12 desaturase)
MLCPISRTGQDLAVVCPQPVCRPARREARVRDPAGVAAGDGAASKLEASGDRFTSVASPPGQDSGSSSRFELDILAPYRKPDLRRSVVQIVDTGVPLGALWLTMLFFVGRAYWVTLLLAVPAAAFLIRLFIIQHDCGHGAFLKSARASNVIGFVIGVLTLTPYGYWRKIHAIHHATSGNLEHRGFGDIDTLTVREYLALGRWRRLTYRLYRNPLVLFVVGPPFQFIVKHRFPMIVPASWRRERLSIHWTNLALAAMVVVMALTIGLKAFLMVQLPITLLASSLGVWLFYVQHQFRDTYWEHEGAWDYFAAGARGSSYYALPKVLQWLTGNIGLHHVHHLNSRIPNYRLQECFDENPVLQTATRLTLWRSFRCIFLKLWDEDQGTLVGYAQARRRLRAGAG